MTHIDLLIVIVAALLVFELRRRLGRTGRQDGRQNQRQDASEKPVHGGLDGYLRSLRDRRGSDSLAAKGMPKGASKDPAKIKPTKPLTPAPDLPFEEVFATVRDTSHEAPTPKPLPPEELSADEKAILAPLRKHQPNFHLREFLGGARYAYEAILEGFATNDFDQLDELLSDPARGVFFGRMKERRAQKHWRAANLVSIEEAKIVETRVEQGVAFIAVRFVSEQFESHRTAKRTPLRTSERINEKSGEKSTSKNETGPLVRVRELWTFRRTLNSNDPNWTVSAVTNCVGAAMA